VQRSASLLNCKAPRVRSNSRRTRTTAVVLESPQFLEKHLRIWIIFREQRKRFLSEQSCVDNCQNLDAGGETTHRPSDFRIENGA